jgi:hypothetical protein
MEAVMTLPHRSFAGLVVSLTRNGEGWVVGGAGRTFWLRNSLGLQYLARLIAEPEREHHALDLAGAGAGAGDNLGVGVDAGVDAGDCGEVLDPEARRAYQRRLEQLAHDLDEAERFGDELRARRARAERELLADELARAVGLGGRERRTGSAAERARVAVTRRIRDAVKRIAAEAPELGRHLDRSIRTGRFCCYQPA